MVEELFSLAPLKEAIALLPANVTAEEGRMYLDLIDAIVFHLVFPMRNKAAENFFAEHYEAPPGQGTITAASLLQRVGLFQPQTIRRR